MKEKLSAFVDNELSELEERHLLSEMGRDEQLRSAWGRYHLIGAALRNDLEQIAPASVHQSVTAALGDRPVQRDRRVLALKLSKAAGGFAIAAGVAAIAILSLRSPLSPQPGTAPIVQASGGAQTVASRGTQAPDQIRARTQADTLNAYLLEHSEFAPTTDMGNLLPYVRTVNHDNNR